MCIVLLASHLEARADVLNESCAVVEHQDSLSSGATNVNAFPGFCRSDVLFPLMCAHRSDMGRASFIPDLVDALEQIAGLGSFNISTIPRLHSKYEIELAEGEIHSLPIISMPLVEVRDPPPGASSSVVSHRGIVNHFSGFFYLVTLILIQPRPLSYREQPCSWRSIHRGEPFSCWTSSTLMASALL